MERRERRAAMLLGLVDGGGHLWADCIPALGLLFKDKMKQLTETPSPPPTASMSHYPYGVLLLRPRNE